MRVLVAVASLAAARAATGVETHEFTAIPAPGEIDDDIVAASVVAVARVPAPHAAVLVAAHEAVADRAERDAVARLLVGPAWEATGVSEARRCKILRAAGSRRSRVREQVARS